MKAKSILKAMAITLCAVAVLSLGSCKKCTECHYTYTMASGMEMEEELGETCGKTADIDAAKKACEDAAATKTNGKCECHD